MGNGLRPAPLFKVKSIIRLKLMYRVWKILNSIIEVSACHDVHLMENRFFAYSNRMALKSCICLVMAFSVGRRSTLDAP